MQKSRAVIVALGALFLGIGAVFVADGLLVSAAAVILKSRGDFALGVITALFFTGAISCMLFAPRIIATLGFVRSYSLFSALFALVCLAHTLSSNLVLWGILRFFVGFCYYSLVLIAESWLNARAKESIRSRVLSFYEIVFYVCFGIGTVIMGLNFSIDALFLIAASFIILGQIPLALTSTRTPKLASQPTRRLPDVFSLAPLALATSVVAGLLMNGFFTMAAAFVLSVGGSVADASLFIVCGMCGGAFAHTICGSFSDKFGRKYAIILFGLVALAGCVVLFFGALFAGAVVLGFGIFVMYSLALARANDVVGDPSKCVEVGRTLLFAYLIGSIASPLLISGFLHVFGGNGYVFFNVLFLVCLLIFALFQKFVPKHLRREFRRHGGKSLVYTEN